jgi:hypothetical protein
MEYRLIGKGKIPRIVNGVFNDISLRYRDSCQRERDDGVLKLKNKETKEPVATFLTSGNRLVFNRDEEESILAEEIKSGLKKGGLLLRIIQNG